MLIELVIEVEINWMIQFFYGGLRTSVTSERVNDIDNAIINAIKYINIANCAGNELAVQSLI